MDENQIMEKYFEIINHIQNTQNHVTIFEYTRYYINILLIIFVTPPNKILIVIVYLNGQIYR